MEEIIMIRKNTIKSIIFSCCLVLGLLFWQSCNMDKAVFDSIQESLFTNSGHANSEADAFTHWDEDVPPLVSTSCAKCHSTGGFIEFALTGKVNTAAEPGAFKCELCHLDPEGGPTRVIQNVKFPSGEVITGPLDENENPTPLGPEGICMTCHQGRESTVSVNSYLAGKGVVGEDTVSSSLGFRNVHYFAAGATMFGTLTKGGYEYPGKEYDAKFGHVEGYTSCIDCHDQHSLEIRIERCDTCHTYVKDESDLHDIRWFGSLTDYDGDGNINEGIYYELTDIRNKLYNAIKVYASNVTGTPIGYSGSSYPYFFKDTNGDGTIDESEAVYANAYKSFTPRLIKATYNFQFATKDPGAFAHGGKYVIQLMYDSIMDLNSVTGGTNMKGMHRDDEGHFNGSAAPWRHWDGDGEVSTSCAKCHSATGLPIFIANDGVIEDPQPLSNGLLCTTCHTSPPSVRQVANVKFPSGVVADIGDNSNLCMLCHQGRASKFSIDSKIAGSSGPYSFTNIHYYPVGAILFGSEVHGAYEYPGKTYAGRQMFPNHDGKFTTCVECHMGIKGVDPHNGHNVEEPNPADCVNCHGQDVSQPNPGSDSTKFKFSGIRPASIPDYDGDGDTTESLKYEIRGLEATLYAQIQKYGFKIKSPVVYDPNSYPYWFKDLNGNRIADSNETSYSNSYKFNATILKAAYNYHTSIKEPHGYIHNAPYIAQILVDSIQDLGGNISPYTWR